MYQGYHIAVILLCYCLSVLGLDKCDIICDIKGCRTETVDLGLDKCTYEDIQTIPDNFNFTTKDGEPSVYPASLEISFIPPKSECMSKITLLANESINETECETHDFHNLNRTEVHTSEKRICFDRNTTPILNISYQYIFTACYAVQFSSFSHAKIEKYTFQKFLKTNYKRTEIATPQLACTYQSIDYNETEEFLYFEVDVTVSLVSELNLGLGLIDYSTGQANCDIYGDVYELRKNWSFNISEIYYEFENTTSGDSTSTQNREKYRKLISFDIKPIQNRSYCFYININDERCEDNSLWKPSYQKCHSIPTVIHIIDMAKLVNGINNYIYWIIIVTSLTGLIIFMTLSFVYVVNTHIWKKHKKSDLLNVLKDKDSLAMCTDIVLLYPKGSKSFMSLMAEFRELLSRACQCSVYDWYNATECNYVAEMGGCDWFTEMLNKGCRIIWIDTPTSRSLIAKKFKSRLLVKNSKEYKFDEICDFRDLAFTAIFDLAKHNIEQLHTDTKHNKNFIVRLKGFEIFDNEKDPFRCLHPDTCYIIPEDLNLLCSKLSLLKSSGENKFIELWPHHSDSLSVL